MRKSGIVLLMLLVLVPSLVAAVTYSNNFGSLTVEPEIAYPHKDGFVQTATLCSNLSNPVNLSFGFLFDIDPRFMRLRNEGRQLLNMENERINPRQRGFPTNNDNAFYYRNVEFNPDECHTYDLNYRADTVVGKWDFIAWTGRFNNPGRTWLLDPLFNSSWYQNEFFSAADISDWEETVNITMAQGTGFAYLTNATTESTGLLANILHYWKFDESGSTTNASDDAGDWDLVTAAPLWDPGIINNGFHNVGATDQLLNNTIQGIDEPSNYTITGWIYKVGTAPALFCYGRAGSAQNYVTAYFHSGAGISAVEVTSGGVPQTGTTATVPANGVWTFIAVNINHDAQTMSMWINGVVRVDNASMTAAAITGTTQYVVGNSADCNEGAHAAQYDEMGFWNRTLTVDEINTLYNSGAGNSYTFGESLNEANATYGYAVTSNISLIGSFSNGALSFIAEGNDVGASRNNINFTASNDGGLNWLNMACQVTVATANGDTYVCNSTIFGTSGNKLKLNMTMNNFVAGDVDQPMIFNLSYQILDLITNITWVEYSDANIYEGMIANYSLNVTAPAGSVTNVTAYFIFNDTVNPQPLFMDYQDGEVWVFSSGLVIPNRPDLISSQAITSTWNISVTTASLYFEDTQWVNQTYNPQEYLDNCSLYSTVVANFSVQDEDSVGSFLPFNFEATFDFYGYDYTSYGNASISMNNTNLVNLCIANNRTMLVNMTGFNEVQGGFRQRWFLINETLNNESVKEVTMYNRPTTVGISLLSGVVRYDDFIVWAGLYAFLERFYPGEGIWRMVQMDKSDEFGQIYFNIKEADTDYRITFYDWYAHTLRVTNTLKFLCTNGVCSFTFIVPETFSAESTFVSDLSFDSVTQLITGVWSNTAATSGNVRFLVTQEYTNSSILTLCDANYTVIPGSATCSTAGFEGYVIGRIYANALDTTPNSFEVFLVSQQTLSDVIDPKDAAFYIFIMVLVFAGATMYSPVAVVIGVFAAFAGLFFLGISSLITTGVLLIIGSLAFVIALKVRK